MQNVVAGSSGEELRVKLPLYQTNHHQQHHCAQHGHEEAVQVEAGHADAAEIAHQKAADGRADDADNDVGD